MGGAVSSEVSDPNPQGHHGLGKHLETQNREIFDEFWSRAAGSRSVYLSISQFVAASGFPEESISASIFNYLSLGNDKIEKEFLENRVRDLMQHDKSTSFTTAPWTTILDVAHISPAMALSIACWSRNAIVATEAKTIAELVKQVPGIEAAFNHAVVESVISGFTAKPSLNFPADSIANLSDQTLLALIAPGAATPNLMFSSSVNGSSFRVLGPAIKYYPGKLLFLLKGSDSIFGFMSNRSEWAETRGFDENARDSILFQLSPELRVRHVTARGASNCVYFNLTNPNHPLGIGLGGREDSFRLWLDGSNMGSVTCMQSDATFEPGHILSCAPTDSYEFRCTVHAIEIWGLSGPDALYQQQERKGAEAEVRQDRKKVDKSKLLHNDFDKEMFFQKTFAGNASAAQNRLGTG